MSGFRRGVLVVATAGLLASFGLQPNSAFADHCGSGATDEACVDGQGDGFEANDDSTTASRDGVAPVGGGGPASPLRRETKYVPACDGNDATTDIGLCTAAIATCPSPEEVRFWVFRRTINLDNRAADAPFVRVINPDSVCIRPDDPRIDPTIAIPSIVDREFKRVVVLKGVAEVSPAPDTLVNLETRFTTAAPASYEIPLTILGQSVVITAKATSWTWHFGDGQTQRLTDGSSTVHTYDRAGARGAFVVIEWSGTYRIGGDPTVRQVNGTATTTGDPVQVQVRTARTELVDQPG